MLQRFFQRKLVSSYISLVLSRPSFGFFHSDATGDPRGNVSHQQRNERGPPSGEGVWGFRPGRLREDRGIPQGSRADSAGKGREARGGGVAKVSGWATKTMIRQWKSVMT